MLDRNTTNGYYKQNSSFKKIATKSCKYSYNYNQTFTNESTFGIK